jgi:hypothetical protein
MPRPKLKHVWAVILVIFGALSFFGVPLPRDWRAVMEWVTATEAWLHGHIAHPIVLAFIIGLATGTVIIPEAWSFVRRRLEGPRIEPQFDSVRDIYWNVDLFDEMGQQLPNKATYVQVHVVSVAHVEDCAGWLTQIERLDARGKPVASLRLGGSRSLRWSPQEANLIFVSIDPDIPQNLDIFRVVENVNRIDPMTVGGYPPTWVAFFNMPGVYRITITVAAKGAKSRAIRLHVDWKGQWNNLSVTNAEVT